MRDINQNEKPIPMSYNVKADIKRFKLILENLDGAFVFSENDDEDVRVVYTSLSMINPFYSGLSDASTRDQAIWGIILPEDFDLLKANIIKASQSSEPLDCTYRVYNADNEVEWRHIYGTHLPEQKDGIHRMLHSVSDITELKKNEVVQLEKDRIIDFAMRNTDVNLWYFDYENSQCQLTESCQKAHEMLGVEVLDNFPECLISTGYVREDCVDILRESYKKLRETGECVEFDVWFRKANGSGWWCERDMLSPLIGHDGMVSRGIGIGKNVTAEKELEERYHAFQSYGSLAENNKIIFARMNLSTGWCGEFSGSLASISERRITTIYGFLEALSEIMPICSDPPDALNPLRSNMLELFLSGEESVSYEYRCLLEKELSVWVRTTIDMMKNPVTGNIEALYSTLNIDYEKNMSSVADQLMTVDYEFIGLIDVYSGRLRVFGYNKDAHGMARNDSYYDSEVLRVFRVLIHDEYYEEAVRNMQRKHLLKELEKKETYTCSFPARSFANAKSGRKQWKFCYLDKTRRQILMTRTDITDIYTAERDELTGLYNRNSFYRHAREILLANPKLNFVMLRLDIDRFKAYNDARGTKSGDRLLAEFGREIRKHLWPVNSLFGHFEADHFCVLFPKSSLKLIKRLRLYYRWIEKLTPNYRLISSVGIYDITDHNIDVSSMCDRALLALRTVKDAYDIKIAWYDDGLRKKLRSEQRLIDEMEQAIQKEQFTLYFQPQMNYESGEIIGAEALVRWIHPERGLIPPNDFIPLFEKNGFILKLDAYVWERACMHLRYWIDNGYDIVVPISVNISRYDISDSTLCDRLKSLMERYSLSPSLLNLEITESAYMENPELLLKVAQNLQKLGFTVEMDDFGAGYSSLNTLKDVQVDVLKLDMRFLSNGWDNARGGLILSSVIRMAQWLGLPVIAEGVETKEQAEYLKSLNCRYMQGYLFAKPMPAIEFEEKLRTLSLGGIKNDTVPSNVSALWHPETIESTASIHLGEISQRVFSNQELQQIARQSGILICRYYIDSRTIERFYDHPDLYFGIPVIEKNVPESMISKRLVSTDTLATYLSMYDMIAKGIPTGSCEIKLLTKERGYCWYHAEYSFVYDIKGEANHALITFLDITKRRNEQDKSEKWRALFAKIFSDAIICAGVNLTKNSVEQIEQRNGKELITPITSIEDLADFGRFGDLDKATDSEYNAFLDRGRLIGLFSEDVLDDNFDYCLYSDSGTTWMRVAVSMSKYSDSSDIMAVISYSTLSEQKLEIEELTHKAYYDALTDILNREGFDKRASEIISAYDKRFTTALFIIDLDNFKQVNDKLGHQIGDAVLKEVADTLRESFRSVDAVGRIGGDEFVVLLSGDFEQGFLEKKATKLLNDMKLDMSNNKKKQVTISISIGIAYGRGRTSFDRLYKMADISLYSAKKAGKCRFHVINTDTNEEDDFSNNNASTDLISLQSLLEYAEDGVAVKSLTPYEALLKSIPGGVMIMSITDTDEIKITHCNDWQINTFGYTKEELEGLQRINPFAIIHPDDIPSIFDMISHAKNGDIDDGSCIYRVKNKTGRYIYVQLNASITERTKDETILYGIQTDIDNVITTGNALG